MWKKVLLVLVLISIMPLTKVSATDDSYSGITIIPNNCVQDPETYERSFEGNIDILINTNDFDSEKVNNFVSEEFIDDFPNYEDFQHLNNSDEWVSYSAFYSTGSGVIYRESCLAVFSTSDGDYSDIKRIKIVYFDDNGDTIFMTEEIEIPIANFLQLRYGHITLDIENQSFINEFDLRTNTYIFFYAIMLIIFVLLISLSKILTLFILNMSSKLRIVLVSGLYHFISLYIFLFVIQGFLIVDSMFGIVFTIFVFIGLESIIILITFKSRETIKNLLKYELISYIILAVILILSGFLTSL